MKQKKPIMKPKKPLIVILGLFFIALIAYGLYNYTDFFKFSTKNNDPQKTNSTQSTNSTENVDIPTPSPTPQISPMPKEWQDNGIFNAYYEKAYEKMSQMTVEQKLSQLLWVRCPEGDIATSEIKTLQPGGLVLFKRDFEGKTAEEIQKNINAYQTASDIPLLIATDEEGGKIIRASQNKKLRETPFASPMEIFAKGGVSAEVADANAKADFLKNLGVNVVLAPVADVSTDPENYIYDRTIGQNAEVTADYVSQVVGAFNAKNIGSSLKHFPGYGTNIDTHGSLAVDTRPKETFENGDLLPFKSGISAGVPCVLVSHNIVNAYDEANPASLSVNVHNLLRNDMGFTGVITTDELDMGAIKEFANNESAAAKAFFAGNDMLMMTDYVGGYNALYTAYKAGNLDLEQLDRSVVRILSWKLSLGLAW